MASAVESSNALARLFERAHRTGEAMGLTVPGGAALFQAGEASETLYLLRYGRLGASATDPDGKTRLLGIVHPGETVGEFSLLTGETHQATVTALRDSELWAMERHTFLAAAGRDAAAMGELARLIAERARHIAPGAPVSPPRVFGLVALSQGLAVHDLAEELCRAMAEGGWKALSAGPEAAAEGLEWFSRFEASGDFVIYAAEAGDDDWIDRLSRQIDHMMLVADGERHPPAITDTLGRAAARFGPLADLVLSHPARKRTPSGGAAFERALSPNRVLHLRRGHRQDLGRLARRITSQGVGLVLSGGAARAYAHVGALKALSAAKVPVDFVAGVSMGAIIGAGEAMEWDPAELDRRIRKAFVESSPVDDIAFPIVSMTHGRKVRRRLAEHFGDRDIEDLWRPFFCLSTNLTTGAYQLHRRGKVREALTASVALPGLLPPVVKNRQVLVDGAVIKNFPVDVMRGYHSGPIIGIDVTRAQSITAKELTGEFSLWRWIVSGAWRDGPPIVSILMRAGTVGAERDIAAARAAADVLVLPPIEDIEIRDWKAYAPAVEAGELAMRQALDALDRPVTELRLSPRSKPWSTA
ncbi:MAG TPA: patatin-like phospholipase family protein [Caulobacteraceae bacterium]|nr:patatin-like phospholipase family protein [Caulobacteraceae bacterium]